MENLQQIIDAIGGLSTVIGGGVGAAVAAATTLYKMVGFFTKRDHKEAMLAGTVMGLLVSTIGRWRFRRAKWENEIEPMLEENMEPFMTGMSDGLSLDDNGWKNIFRLLTKKYKL